MEISHVDGRDEMVMVKNVYDHDVVDGDDGRNNDDDVVDGDVVE